MISRRRAIVAGLGAAFWGAGLARAYGQEAAIIFMCFTPR